MGSQTKRFSKGKYHIDEPVAKEQFSTSFYGEYLGESKASDDAIGSDIDFGNLLNETPYDEQQRRLRTARDEQSPLDNPHKTVVLSCHQFCKRVSLVSW